MQKAVWAALAAAACSSGLVAAQSPTMQELFQRNVGTPAQQTAAFPPHRIVGPIYYVGTESLSSFVVATPAGHVLVNSNYERNVPVIRESMAKLGLKFEDI